MSRILVIDDSRSAPQVTQMILAEAGYEVRPCGDGRRAIEILVREPFDVVITDIYILLDSRKATYKVGYILAAS